MWGFFLLFEPGVDVVDRSPGVSHELDDSSMACTSEFDETGSFGLLHDYKCYGAKKSEEYNTQDCNFFIGTL
uniref:Uncharacterized protein n=1 Tax=Lepeophtheirus salmonis TaxID=72036 RepID=A0A0K2TI13_LEPSM